MLFLFDTENGDGRLNRSPLAHPLCFIKLSTYQTSIHGKAILLSKEQVDVCEEPLQSTFITGTFGTGKTELAFQLIKKFCDFVIEKHTSRGIVIASAFSPRGYCNKLIKEYDDMITQHLRVDSFIGYGISRLVGIKDWLLERFQVKENASLVLVINKLMQRIAKVHKSVPILLVLDEVSISYEYVGGDWRHLKIPEHMTLVFILKPTTCPDTQLPFVPPSPSTMRSVNLKRQYRCGTILNRFLIVMSQMLRLHENFTTLMPELEESQEKGHEIPGAIPEWFHQEYDERGNIQLALTLLMPGGGQICHPPFFLKVHIGKTV